MKSLTVGLISVGCLLAAGRADAHFSLDFPKGRSNSIELAPCGPSGSTRGSSVSTFHPGETVTIQWTVQVEHTMPGRWRISLDDSGQDFPDPVGPNDTSKLPLFMDNLAVTGLGMKQTTITLPNMECSSCTLQLLQYKLEKPPYDAAGSFYYQCADLVISKDGVSSQPGGGTGGSGTGGSGTGGSAPPTPTPTAGTGGSGGAASSASAAPGGCSLVAQRTTGGTSAAWLTLALLSLLRRRQR